VVLSEIVGLWAQVAGKGTWSGSGADPAPVRSASAAPARRWPCEQQEPQVPEHSAVEFARGFRLVEDLHDAYGHRPASGRRPIDAVAHRKSQHRAANRGQNRNLLYIAFSASRVDQRALEFPTVGLRAEPDGGVHRDTADLIALLLIENLAQGHAIIRRALILVVTMTLSDLMNNAAAVAVMCPIAIGTASHPG
jgi:hypothetical protein